MVFDSTATAKSILGNKSFQTVSGSLSAFDRNDFYQFNLSSANSFHASVNGLTADASLSILNTSGQVLQTSNRSGTVAESINIGLTAGTYYLRVSHVTASTIYDLQFSTNSLFANISDSVKFFAGDFNGDSYQDVIRQERGSLVNGVADAQFFLGRADGSYTAGTNLASMDMFTGNASNLVVGDFNGDGRDDLIRQEFGGLVNGVNDTQIATFNGSNFQAVGNIQDMNAFNGNLVNIIAGDFNQDGRTDLIRQEKGTWIDNFRDVEIYLSTGGWSFSTIAISNAHLLTGNDIRLITSGRDMMRLENSRWVDGIYDILFTSFVNGNFQGFATNPPSGFTQAMVQKPWELPISQAYVPALGKLVSNQATLISPYGTTGRYSLYDTGATIYWSAKTGARVITKEMEAVYHPNGGSRGWLGMPTTNQYSWNSGIRQDFEGGYIFRDANQAAAFRSNQIPAFAPNTLQIQGLQTSYQANSVLNISTGFVSDSNGWSDVKSVDFWLVNAQNQRIELADVVSFTAQDATRAKFSYSTNLGNLALGSYTLRGMAYDRNGLKSNLVEQKFAIVSPNVAPSSLQIQGLQESYQANTNLSLNTGFVFDANGWTDVRSVDFWLTNAQNQRIELADVSSFSSYDSNWAKFSYSASLSGLAAGSYTLRAVAYDRSGTISSNAIAQSFSILRTQDWFDINLKDSNIATLARSASSDRDLSRNEMLGIFRDIQDGGIIDAIEWGDIGTLVKNATGSLFSMKDHVHYLSTKVVTETVANMAANVFNHSVMGKWFLGTIGPKAEFTQKSSQAPDVTHSLQYKQATGSLFGIHNQARISGIDQGSIGDCVLLASIGATFGLQTAEWGNASQVVNQMLIDNGDQTYTVRFFNEKKELQAEWVTVDSKLAYWTDGRLLGARTNDGLFMPILEKAYAQWREWTVNDGRSGWTIIGNGDFIDQGIQRIVGRTATNYFATGTNSYTFDLIQKALLGGKSITSGTATNSSYLVGSHAYSVTHAYTSASGQQRVVVYNPWGVDGGQVMQGSNDGFVDLSFEEFRSFNHIAIA
jgi:hypothetical protein